MITRALVRAYASAWGTAGSEDTTAAAAEEGSEKPLTLTDVTAL